MNIWNEFAELIGVSKPHAEAALYSERAARATLSRRGMFGASAALATGIAFGFPAIAASKRLVFLGPGIWKLGYLDNKRDAHCQTFKGPMVLDLSLINQGIVQRA